MRASTTSRSPRPRGSSVGPPRDPARPTTPASPRSASDGAVLPALAEVFRTHGYEGASLALISAATGLGKGSLYHLFPGGKQQMAEAVLEQVDAWFRAQVFTPLRTLPPAEGVPRMFTATAAFFQDGGRVCLVGVLALGAARDSFAQAVAGYFREWRDALADALRRLGHAPEEATALAEEVVAGVQGALVLARALDAPAGFNRLLDRLQARALKVP